LVIKIKEHDVHIDEEDLEFVKSKNGMYIKEDVVRIIG
jgi:hypothetical protein